MVRTAATLPGRSRSEPDTQVILTGRMTLDVSGRPLRLRDVDLDTFLHPRTIAVIGASESARKPNGAMTSKFKAWAEQHGARMLPVHPEHETVFGIPVYK